MVGTPHWAILPWARYCRIDPLGLNQNARWTDLLLMTGLTGQLRKGQFSSHWSTDWCTLNTHQSYRDPVIRVPVITSGSRGSIERYDQNTLSHAEIFSFAAVKYLQSGNMDWRIFYENLKSISMAIMDIMSMATVQTLGLQ